MWAWAVLGGAIAAEVTGTLALRASDGFSHPGFAVVTAVGYLVSFGLLGVALKDLPVGVAYAVWSALGTVGAASGGVVLFRERADWRLVVGVVVVIIGVALVSLSEGGTRG